ncbi:hypothetical protein QVD17_32345 [Tagetes erecta]|uniref:Nuclear pore complex protein NUP1 n=1 Tax=Tagetes erecta TaxID=13708 RepID=A0AAD8NPD1_TARER|nr:hypothetical protein QVD17_32345 [Tagetes erecta]
MATSGDGTAPYQTTGAGGKFRKKPFRRNIPATPYDRPPTAIRNDNPSMLKKLVDPASRLISAGAHKLFDVFRKSLPSPSLKLPEINEEPQNVLHKEGGDGSSASISAATGVSDLEVLLQQKTFTRSEVQRLTSLLHSKTIEPPSDNSLKKHGDKRDDFNAAIATPVGASRVLEEETASPAELAKYYMGSRLTSQATRQDSKLIPRTPITPVAQMAANSLRNLENGFVTPRSRGRSAMYTMARGPYSTSPSTFCQQGVKLDYGHGAALTSSQGHAGKMALKRRSSVLDEDIGSGGPLRRIRQKANLISQSDKKELGYPVFHQPSGEGQTLLLTNEPEPKVPNYASVPTKSTQTANKILQHLDKPSRIEKSSVSTLSGMRDNSPNELRLDMLHGQALRSLEKVDSPKFLPRSHDIQKPMASESTLQSKDKTEENCVSKFPLSHNMLTSVGVDKTDTLKDKAPIVEIADLPSKVIEEPQKRHAFQMSAPEDSFEMDDDDDDIHENGHVSLPFLENNKSETSAADIIKTPTLAVVSKIPELVENNKPKFSEVSKVPEQFELKKAENDISTPKTDFGSLGGSVNEQGIGFKIPVSSFSSPSVTATQTSEFTQSTFQMEKNPPVKVSPFLFSANEQPNAGSDSNLTDSISVFNSVPKNDQVKFSVSNKDDNGNWNGNDQKSTNMFGKSESVSAAASAVTSTNGIFSFGTSTKNLNNSDTTPASNPPTFPPLAPLPASTANATTISAASTMTVISTTSAPAVISSVSVSPQAFSFGSATSTAPTTSVAETGNTGTSTSSPFAITTFATTTTTTGSGLFGFSSPAAATSTLTTTESGPFGFSSSAAATSTTNSTTAAGSGLFGVSSAVAPTSTATTTGSGLFGFSSSAAATSTTTGSGLFGFSSPAAATSTTNTGSGPFGFGSSAATSTTTTGSGLFGFSSPAAATSTTPTGSGLFGFSSPAASTSTTTTTATGSGLFGFGSSAAATAATSTGSGPFGFGSSAAATSTTTSQSQGSFFNITNGFQASTNASSSSTLFGSSAPAFGSSSNFGITSVGPTSETKSGNSTGASTNSIFGSTWQQPQQSSGFGSTFTSSPSPSVFSFGASSASTPSFVTAGASSSSFGGSSVFGNSTPVFGAVAATSPSNNNNNNNNNNNSDQMSMEDSMAEDSMQTHSPVSPFGQAPVSPFGQAPVSAPGFMFGQATPTPAPALNPPAASFSFGGQPNQAPPPQNPFQSSSVEFNAGGGSFSLGSGGEKSNRRIVRVMKSKNRKK